MDMKTLRQLNQIEAVTKETVESLTEPIQPMYLMLKPEQYNLIAKHISLTGKAIAENTVSILKLPTQEALDQIVEETMKSYLWKMMDSATGKMDSIEYSVTNKLSKQTDSLERLVRDEVWNMLKQLKANDLTHWKSKVKWALIGATLPSVACILLLTLQ